MFGGRRAKRSCVAHGSRVGEDRVDGGFQEVLNQFLDSALRWPLLQDIDDEAIPLAAVNKNFFLVPDRLSNLKLRIE